MSIMPACPAKALERLPALSSIRKINCFRSGFKGAFCPVRGFVLSAFARSCTFTRRKIFRGRKEISVWPSRIADRRQPVHDFTFIVIGLVLLVWTFVWPTTAQSDTLIFDLHTTEERLLKLRQAIAPADFFASSDGRDLFIRGEIQALEPLDSDPHGKILIDVWWRPDSSAGKVWSLDTVAFRRSDFLSLQLEIENSFDFELLLSKHTRNRGPGPVPAWWAEVDKLVDPKGFSGINMGEFGPELDAVSTGFDRGLLISYLRQPAEYRNWRLQRSLNVQPNTEAYEKWRELVIDPLNWEHQDLATADAWVNKILKAIVLDERRNPDNPAFRNQAFDVLGYLSGLIRVDPRLDAARNPWVNPNVPHDIFKAHQASRYGQAVLESLTSVAAAKPECFEPGTGPESLKYYSRPDIDDVPFDFEERTAYFLERRERLGMTAPDGSSLHPPPLPPVENRPVEPGDFAYWALKVLEIYPMWLMAHEYYTSLVPTSKLIDIASPRWSAPCKGPAPIPGRSYHEQARRTVITALTNGHEAPALRHYVDLYGQDFAIEKMQRKLRQEITLKLLSNYRDAVGREASQLIFLTAPSPMDVITELSAGQIFGLLIFSYTLEEIENDSDLWRRERDDFVSFLLLTSELMGPGARTPGTELDSHLTESLEIADGVRRQIGALGGFSPSIDFTEGDGPPLAHYTDAYLSKLSEIRPILDQPPDEALEVLRHYADDALEAYITARKGDIRR